MINPKVSIIMPTYNVERFIPQAIESVLQQTHHDWELLIIDDGSTDNSNSVAQRYADKDSRITVFKKKNGGLSDARNYGLEKASGEYVHFFDSDDSIVPNFYETLLNAIEKDDFIICGYYKDFEQDDNSIKTVEIKCDSIDYPMPQDFDYYPILTQCFNYAWNKIFRRSFLQKKHLFYEKGLSIIEDKEFMSRVIDYYPQFRFINFLGYRYKVRKRNTLGNQFNENLIPCHIRGIAIQNKIFTFFVKDNITLKQNMGHLVLSIYKWILHCIFAYSTASKKRKIELIEMMLQDNSISKNLSYYNPNIFKDRLLKALLMKRQSSLIYMFYNLSNNLTF